MGIEYAWEKSFNAVCGMARSPADIRDRITTAYVYHLIHIRPDEDLPGEHLPRLLDEIRAAMTATPAVGDEGSAQASAKAMSQEKAAEVAQKIVDLFDAIVAARY